MVVRARVGVVAVVMPAHRAWRGSRGLSCGGLSGWGIRLVEHRQKLLWVRLNVLQQLRVLGADVLRGGGKVESNGIGALGRV